MLLNFFVESNKTCFLFERKKSFVLFQLNFLTIFFVCHLLPSLSLSLERFFHLVRSQFTFKAFSDEEKKNWVDKKELHCLDFDVLLTLF